MALSIDLRKGIVKVYEKEEGSIRKLGKQHDLTLLELQERLIKYKNVKVSLVTIHYACQHCFRRYTVEQVSNKHGLILNGIF